MTAITTTALPMTNCGVKTSSPSSRYRGSVRQIALFHNRAAHTRAHTASPANKQLTLFNGYLGILGAERHQGRRNIGSTEEIVDTLWTHSSEKWRFPAGVKGNHNPLVAGSNPAGATNFCFPHRSSFCQLPASRARTTTERSQWLRAIRREFANSRSLVRLLSLWGMEWSCSL